MSTNGPKNVTNQTPTSLPEGALAKFVAPQPKAEPGKGGFKAAPAGFTAAPQPDKALEKMAPAQCHVSHAALIPNRPMFNPVSQEAIANTGELKAKAGEALNLTKVPLQRIYEKQLNRNPELTASAIYQITIKPDGTHSVDRKGEFNIEGVTKLKGNQTCEDLAGLLDRAVTASLRRAILPHHPTKTVTVNFPLKFEPVKGDE